MYADNLIILLLFAATRAAGEDEIFSQRGGGVSQETNQSSWRSHQEAWETNERSKVGTMLLQNCERKLKWEQAWVACKNWIGKLMWYYCTV